MVSSLSDPEFDGREGREEKGDGRGGEGNCPESQGERNKHCATGVYPDGVCKCQSDGERQSFWNGDDEHRHADDEELDELLQVVHVPRVLANDERRDGEVEHENHDRQQRYRRAYTCTTATFKQPAYERTIRYDTRSYYNVRSKADMSPYNVCLLAFSQNSSSKITEFILFEFLDKCYFMVYIFRMF